MEEQNQPKKEELKEVKKATKPVKVPKVKLDTRPFTPKSR